MAVERIAGFIESDILRQHDRELGGGHRAAFLAMHDRDQTAPVALARNAPIPQPVIDLTLAFAALLQTVGNFVFCFLDRQPIEKRRIRNPSGADIGFIANVEALRIFSFRNNDRPDLQVIFAGEIQVALIMGRAAENRPGAIVHQDEIGDVNRNFGGLAKRVNRFQPGVVAPLFGTLDIFLAGAHPVALIDEALEILVFFRERFGERMIGRYRAERHAEYRVWPRRENL